MIATTPLAFLDIGFGEMVVVAFVALMLFGGRLPEMMRKFGASYREFKRGLEDVAKNPLTGIKPSGSSVPYRPNLPAFFEPKPPEGVAPTSFAPMPPPVPDPAFAVPPVAAAGAGQTEPPGAPAAVPVPATPSATGHSSLHDDTPPV